MSELNSYLDLVIGFQKLNMPKRDWVYQSYEALVMAEGRTWITATTVDRHGEFKACYMNAFYAAEENDGWRYVEGFAISMIPIMHAWCVNQDDEAVEVTWVTPGTEYRGFEMKLDYVRDTILETGVWGVMPNDYLNGLKLLREGVV